MRILCGYCAVTVRILCGYCADTVSLCKHLYNHKSLESRGMRAGCGRRWVVVVVVVAVVAVLTLAEDALRKSPPT